MNASDPIDVLNRLLRLLCRSLPVYVDDTRPSDPKAPRDLRHRLGVIAADQRALAQRLAEAIAERKGQIHSGHFPLEFTATHDLALEYLAARAIAYQKRDVEAIRECVEALSGEPSLLPLAEEILGDARGHLETLEEMAGGA